jgi:hypothetical protein
MSRVSSRNNKGQRSSVKYDDEQADQSVKPEKRGKSESVLDPTSEQLHPNPASKAKSKPRGMSDSKSQPKSKAATIVREEEVTVSLVGKKRKADSQPSTAALTWDMEEHPEEKRLAAYRPRCSDACKWEPHISYPKIALEAVL